MSKPNEEATLALKKTIKVWKLISTKGISKRAAIAVLYPEDISITCDCYLCEYTRQFANLRVSEYDCDYCPADLDCDEDYSPYRIYGGDMRSTAKERELAVKVILAKCRLGLKKNQARKNND